MSRKYGVCHKNNGGLLRARRTTHRMNLQCGRWQWLPKSVNSAGGVSKGPATKGSADGGGRHHPPLFLHCHHHHIPILWEKSGGWGVADEWQSGLVHRCACINYDASKHHVKEGTVCKNGYPWRHNGQRTQPKSSGCISNERARSLWDSANINRYPEPDYPYPDQLQVSNGTEP